MSVRLDALRTQIKRYRFESEDDCVDWLCSASYASG
jgi:hypothetical protein